jgi:hypothetical protein
MREAMVLPAVLIGCSILNVFAAEAAETPRLIIPVDDAGLRLAPYVWKRSGAGPTARIEATMPGAYLRTDFRGSGAIRLAVDGTANLGCPEASLPLIDHSIDGGAFKSSKLRATDGIYSLPLADSLDAAAGHRLEVHFRSAHLGPERWTSSKVHVRLAGIELDDGGSLLPRPPAAPRSAIGFGDSITEGVCSEGACPYYSDLSMNNARVTWFPLVCAALDCEYGQLGTGGQGIVRRLEMPPLPETWDRYDAGASRLVGGRLDPEPDFIFCAMGTNDFQGEGDRRTMLPIAGEYLRWLAAARGACPRARIFCIVPPLGWHAEEIAGAVSARNEAGDRRVHLIDMVHLRAGFSVKGPTPLAADGVHPSVLGNAVLAARIAVEVQKVLDREGGKP